MALDNNTQLVYTDKTTLKNWFKTGLKPKQDQFWAQFDSYWHKSESLPISSISGLGSLLDGKAETEHTHTEYATNDATSLTAQNITQWQNKLGINDLDYVVIPTEDATENSHPYVVVIDNEGNSARRNATDFGKVDTIDGIEADENKDVKLGAVRKSESNTVTDDFSMQQENGAFVSIASNGLKVGFGGITATYGTSSIYVDNLVPDAAYKFQEILFPKRAVKNVEEKVYPVTYIQGVKADETGRVDISGVAMNWTNASQRFSGLINKSSDATYNVFPVLDSNGNLAKASNAINALINTASIASQSQKNIFLSYLNGSNFSGTISITSFGNPFVFKNKGIQQLNVIGLNLNLDINNANVFVIKSGTTTEIPVNFSNVNSTTLAIQLNTDSLDEGEYYVRIRANFQNHTSVRLFRLLDISNSETIDLSSQTATIIYNSNIPNPTGLYSVSNGAIITNSYDTSVVENNPFGAISITLGNLTFEDDFIISGTYNSTGGNPANLVNTHTFGISTGVISALVNPVLYGFTPRNYQNKQSVALVGASGETGPTNGYSGTSFSFSWVISKSESMITINVINPSTGVSVFNAASIIDHSGSVTFSFFGSRNQGNWIASTNIASAIKINK